MLAEEIKRRYGELRYRGTDGEWYALRENFPICLRLTMTGDAIIGERKGEDLDPEHVLIDRGGEIGADFYQVRIRDGRLEVRQRDGSYSPGPEIMIGEVGAS